MSAYLCSPDTFDLIASFAARHFYRRASIRVELRATMPDVQPLKDSGILPDDAYQVSVQLPENRLRLGHIGGLVRVSRRVAQNGRQQAHPGLMRPRFSDSGQSALASDEAVVLGPGQKLAVPATSAQRVKDRQQLRVA